MFLFRTKPTSNQDKSRLRVRPAMECLEDRSVPSATPQTFVPQLYVDLLQRTADNAGVMTYQTALNQGASTTAVAQGMVNSGEFQTNQIVSLYGQLLHRTADQAGINANLAGLASGGTVLQVEASLLASNEFFNTQGGGTNQGFVNALYADVLNRSADPGGSQAAVQALNQGASRMSVASAIIDSTEGLQDLVSSYYVALLNRPADTAGLNSAVSAVQSGTNIDTVIAGIAGSQEYVNFSAQADTVTRLDPQTTPFSNPFAGTYTGQFLGAASGVDDKGKPFSLDVSGSFTATIDNNGKITFSGSADQGGSGGGTGTVNPTGSSNMTTASGLGSGVAEGGSGSGTFSGTGAISGNAVLFTGTWSGSGHSTTGSGHGSGAGDWSATRDQGT